MRAGRNARGAHPSFNGPLPLRSVLFHSRNNFSDSPEDRSRTMAARRFTVGSRALTVNLPFSAYSNATSTGVPAGQPAGQIVNDALADVRRILSRGVAALNNGYSHAVLVVAVSLEPRGHARGSGVLRGIMTLRSLRPGGRSRPNTPRLCEFTFRMLMFASRVPSRFMSRPA